jgi:hypothetical protein
VGWGLVGARRRCRIYAERDEVLAVVVVQDIAGHFRGMWYIVINDNERAIDAESRMDIKEKEMENTIEKKARLNWAVDENQMVVRFDVETSLTFVYAEIKDYVKVENPIVFGLFQHGLKQKLADCVAGMTKNGVSFKEQAKVMAEKWEDIRTGVARVRANAKVDPMAEARAKLAAMPEGKEKEQAMVFAKLLGIVKD